MSWYRQRLLSVSAPQGWYSRLLRDRSVQMQEFQEGLGRAAFVCGALDCDRPFLAPLYAFAARHAPGSVKPLPLYLLVTVEYLRRKIRQRRHCECGRTRSSWKEAWRVDAHADENGVGAGGWWPRANERGQIETRIFPWFAIRVTPENAPWARRQGVSGDRLAGSSRPAPCPPGFRSGPRTKRHEDDHPSSRVHRQPRERVRHQQANDDSFPSLCNRDGARGAISSEG